MSSTMQVIQDWWQLIVVVIGLGTVKVLVEVRKLWAKSRTNAVMEAGQQAVQQAGIAGIASMVEALAAAAARERVSAAREEAAWAMVKQVRDDRDARVIEMSDIKEEMADVRAREDLCQAALTELRGQLMEIKRGHETDMKSQARHHDRNMEKFDKEIGRLKKVVLEQSRMLRDAGLDPNVTGVSGLDP